MFESFFPKPKLFFGSLVLWIIFLITVWYSIGETLGNSLGFSLDTEEQVIGLGHFITSEFLWFDLFYLFGTLIFYYSWRRYDSHFWQNWSILGSALLIYLSYATSRLVFFELH